MRKWATGVTVVSTLHNGERHGMTVNSFTSVSLSPPSVLVSLEKVTRTHKLVKQSGLFGVSILSDQQQEVSVRFAGIDSEEEDRFTGLRTYSLRSGVPLLRDSLAGLDCQVVAEYEVGTHTLFIGNVLATQLSSEGGQPLIYYDRHYHKLIHKLDRFF
jgi:flavin reductase (DIM6/NTAB) family NADH-FMN oxidoreductase RutF